MDLYTMTLRGIKTLLAEINMNDYIPVIDECIEKWENEKNCEMLRREFDKGGRLADFAISSKTAETPEKSFWAAQVFSALLAMNAQLADFRRKGISDDMDFIRRNFGAANEIFYAGKCAVCGHIAAAASDVDKYVSKIVIAKRLVNGLQNGNLEDEVKDLADLSCPDIERERKKTILRLDNSGIPHNNKYIKLTVCPKCGREQIVEGRLLKSLKENIFIPLSK